MIPLAQNIKRYFSLKEVIIVVAAIVISISAGIGVFSYLKKDVVIDYNGKQLAVSTMKSTVKEVLEQNSIVVKPEDYVSVPLDSKLQKTKKNEIKIKKAVPIHVVADGKEIQVLTWKDTVKEALAGSSLSLSESDRMEGAKPGDRIVEGMKLKIIRVKEDVLSEKTSIPYKTVTRENKWMDKGKEKVVRDGKEGIQEKQYKVVYEDGKIISKKLVKDSLISNPISKIIEFGTILNFKTSRGEVVRYNKVLNMRATAYTANVQCTGKGPGDPGFGITRSGMRVRKGVVAVDPRVIPLGTRLYVQIAGNTPDYGYAIAADTGSGVKNDIIDLYFDDESAVNRWGCKRAKVYILTD
ncbi:MAG: ubiquitin-like domain-containing protein [Clostridia bacterium]|nr:ubiquitin-like domain-containing protein [Clostridia bacterium]